MPSKPPVFRPAYLPSPTQLKREYETARRREKPWRRWYCTAHWQALRAAQLAKQPLCENCLRAQPQRIRAATVVHHKRPHRGEHLLFFSADNLESACQPCHDGPLQSAEIEASRRH